MLADTGSLTVCRLRLLCGPETASFLSPSLLEWLLPKSLCLIAPHRIPGKDCFVSPNVRKYLFLTVFLAEMSQYDLKIRGVN